MSVICKYKPTGRLSNVSDAATRCPIFSVGGEIIPLKKSICILRDIIEWNYPLFDNQRTQKTNERGSQHSSPNKRQKRDELERIAEVRIEANEFPESTCDEKRWRKSSPSRFFKAWYVKFNFEERTRWVFLEFWSWCSF